MPVFETRAPENMTKSRMMRTVTKLATFVERVPADTRLPSVAEETAARDKNRMWVAGDLP